MLVAVGTAALLVPLAHAGPGSADLVAALFTAVSAVSAVTVTGLTGGHPHLLDPAGPRGDRGARAGGRPGHEVVTAFRHRIPASVVSLSVSVSLLATGTVVLATQVITVVGRAPLDLTLFEVVSAFSTTGLSTGLSVDLPAAGQLALVAVMLVGRLDPITVTTALALRRPPRRRLCSFPTERPIIG